MMTSSLALSLPVEIPDGRLILAVEVTYDYLSLPVEVPDGYLILAVEAPDETVAYVAPI